MLTPPYYPTLNGAAERAVQTIKGKLKKAVGGRFECQLARILLNYRSTLHETMGCSPAELMIGRKLKTALTPLHEVQSLGKAAPAEGSAREDRPPHADCETRDGVYVRNFRDGPPWVPETVTSTSSYHNADVTLRDGRLWRQHREHLPPEFVTPDSPSDAAVEARDFRMVREHMMNKTVSDKLI